MKSTGKKHKNIRGRPQKTGQRLYLSGFNRLLSATRGTYHRRRGHPRSGTHVDCARTIDPGSRGLVLNKDIGFKEEGQTAEVKIDTFNFTKYGTIDAEITDLSNDAISDENLGLVYMAKVLIQKTQIQVNDKVVNLSPGMSVNVEIKTGKRRVIEYFLSPLLRYKQESIRER